jgi:adenosylmethionine-8-amino-7-oxononanoate aminotransferase
MAINPETTPHRHGKFADAWEKDRQHYLHPFTNFDAFGKEGSLVLEHAEGAYVYDAAGNRYLDGIGGLWCVNIGYGREELVEAATEQMRKMAFTNTFVDVTNIPAAELSAKLAELAPGDLNHVMLTTGGSTAVDSACRLIHFYWSCRNKPEKQHIISRKEAYHGSTFLSASIGGKESDRVPEFRYLDHMVHHLSTPSYYRAPPGVSESAFCDWLIDEFRNKVLELGPENVAAFFAEPIMGAGGVHVPPQGYLKQIRDLCLEYDILYVSDEVVTAFGRLGHLFASKDVFDIVPDIITTAKGLTSGYLPLGAAIYSDRIHDVVSEPGHGRWFTNGFTYGGHPVSCAVALRNIELMQQDGFLERVRENGDYFIERLKSLSDVETVGEVRGMRFMACIENVMDKSSKVLFPDDINIGKRISDAAEARGLLVRPIGHLNVLSPPLILTPAQIDFVVDTLRDAITAVHQDLA